MVGMSLDETDWLVDRVPHRLRNTDSFELPASDGTPSLFGTAVRLELWKVGYGRR